VERTATVIRELDGQIIGLQEVESRRTERGEPLAIMAYLRGYKAVIGPTMTRPDGDYGNVLLTTHNVTDTRFIDLTVPGREPRGAIDARLAVQGRELRVIVTHLGLKAGERRYQAKKLAGHLKSNTACVSILLGDINEWFPWSPVLRHFHRCCGTSPALSTFPSQKPWLALDRIWVRPRSALRKVSVHKSALAQIASDHLPLKAYVRHS
jgi:endonuclease/exonuclease/phosphatase family metal-dependent hydrolase